MIHLFTHLAYCSLLSQYYGIQSRKVSLRGFSPIYVSFQNFIVLPFPCFHLTFPSNQLCDLSTSQILHKSFHQYELFLSTIIRDIFLQPPYLDSNISFHTPVSPAPNLHFHLATRAQLNFPTSLISNPPSSIGEYTLFPAAK